MMKVQPAEGEEEHTAELQEYPITDSPRIDVPDLDEESVGRVSDTLGTYSRASFGVYVGNEGAKTFDAWTNMAVDSPSYRRQSRFSRGMSMGADQDTEDDVTGRFQADFAMMSNEDDRDTINNAPSHPSSSTGEANRHIDHGVCDERGRNSRFSLVPISKYGSNGIIFPSDSPALLTGVQKPKEASRISIEPERDGVLARRGRNLSLGVAADSNGQLAENSEPDSPGDQTIIIPSSLGLANIADNDDMEEAVPAESGRRNIQPEVIDQDFVIAGEQESMNSPTSDGQEPVNQTYGSSLLREGRHGSDPALLHVRAEEQQTISNSSAKAPTVEFRLSPQSAAVMKDVALLKHADEFENRKLFHEGSSEENTIHIYEPTISNKNSLPQTSLPKHSKEAHGIERTASTEVSTDALAEQRGQTGSIHGPAAQEVVASHSRAKIISTPVSQETARQADVSGEVITSTPSHAGRASKENCDLSISKHTATPHSALGQKIIENQKVLSATRGQNRDLCISEHPKSARSSARAGRRIEALDSPHQSSSDSLEPNAQIDKFLEQCNVHFDLTLFDYRETLGAPTAGDNNDGNIETPLEEALKKTLVISPLNAVIDKVTGRISTEEKESIKSLEEELLRSRPAFFSRMLDSTSMSNEDLEDHRTQAKRMRKAAKQESRLEWVTSRKKWEGEIRDSILLVVSDAEKYIGELKSRTETVVIQRQAVNDEAQRLGYDLEEFAEEQGDEDCVLQNAIVEGYEELQALEMALSQSKETKSQLDAEREVLERSIANQLAEVERLESFVDAAESNGLENAISDVQALGRIDSDLSGIKLMRIDDKRLSGVLLDIMGFEIHRNGLGIHDVITKSITHPSAPQPVRDFIDDAVTQCAPCIEGLKNVRELSSTFHICVEWLDFCKRFILDVSNYLRTFPGKLLLRSNDTGSLGNDSAGITFIASFHSIKKWTKFDVKFDISTCFNGRGLGRPYQEVASLEVHYSIGAFPSCDKIKHVLRQEGFKQDKSYFNVMDAAAGLWRYIDNDIEL